MNINQIPQFTPVKVQWVDAEGLEGWMANKQFARYSRSKIPHVTTVSQFYSFHYDSHITLLCSHSQTESMQGLRIPLGWIQSIVTLASDELVSLTPTGD